MIFRTDIMKSDASAVREIVKATNFFNSEEIDVAEELVLDRLKWGDSSGYYFVFGEIGSKVIAYCCYGPILGTESSFDLFWIAVHPDFKGKGIGKKILFKSEDLMRDMGCVKVYAETSTQDLYIPTTIFYESSGYIKEAVIKDFYAEGDSKAIYVKRLVI
jgi:ribosomal protein S18 acetylase RimI-like enzyme